MLRGQLKIPFGALQFFLATVALDYFRMLFFPTYHYCSVNSDN